MSHRKTAIYTLTLTLSSEFRAMIYDLNDSKEFIKKYVKSIFSKLIGNNTKVKCDVIGSGDDEHVVTINYTFYYNNAQIKSSRVYVSDDVVDSNGDLELDEDDFIQTVQGNLQSGTSYLLEEAKVSPREWKVEGASLKKATVGKKKKTSPKRKSPSRATAGPAPRKKKGSSKRKVQSPPRAASSSSSNNSSCKGKKKKSCKKPHCSWNVTKRAGKRGKGACINN